MADVVLHQFFFNLAPSLGAQTGILVSESLWIHHCRG